MTVTQEQVIVRLTADNKRLKAALRDSAKSVNNFKGSMQRVAAQLTAVYASVKSVQAIVKYGDAWSNMNAQLKLATKTTKEFAVAQKELFNIAQDARAPLESVSTLYSKMSRATASLDTTQSDLLDITETISKAMVVSGASTTEANSAILQLGQGMASGVLRGEELNSVMENTPRLAQAIADGMGIAVGDLRAMAAEGKVTTDVIVNALKSQAQTIKTEFGGIPQTVGQSMTKLQNASLVVVGRLSTAFGSNKGLASVIDSVTTAVLNAESGIKTFGAFAYSVVSRTAKLFQALANFVLAVGAAMVKNATAAEEFGSKGVAAFDAFLAHDVVGQALDNLAEMNLALVNVGKGADKAGDGMHNLKAKTADTQKVLKTTNETLASGMTSAFRQAMDGATNFGDIFANIAKDIVAQLIHILVVQKAVNAALGMGNSSSELPALPIANGSYSVMANAKGGAYQGGVKKFAKGGIVNAPTNFGMRGSKMGLMGEAGAEAIVPLTRTPGGDLGVKASPVNVNVINNANTNVGIQQNEEGQIDVIISKISSDITRGTGSIGAALEARYNLSKG